MRRSVSYGCLIQREENVRRFSVELLESRTLLASPGSLLQTLFNPTPATSDEFGNTVAASADNLLVGAHFADELAIDDGAVYLFDKAANLLHTYRNPSPDDFDQFGANVALVGDKVLIGAPFEDTGATNAGAAYLFDTSGNLLQSYFNPTPVAADSFGNSVAIVGDKVVIGATNADRSGVFQVGAAYVFDMSGTLLHTILNPTPAIGEEFGGATRGGVDKVLIRSSKDNAGAPASGAAYLFDAASGTLLHSFLNPTPAKSDEFGHAAEVSGEKVLIGAPLDDTAATDTGAAYLFDIDGNLLQTFLNPSPDPSDGFGVNVAFVGDNILIAAEHDDDAATESGAAYLFDASGNLLLTLTSPAPEAGEQFGNYVTGAGDDILVGAFRRDTGATNSGVAYLFGGANQIPVADAGGPYVIQEGDSLALDASDSFDLDGDILSFSWDINGDGTFGDVNGETPTLLWNDLDTLGIDDGPATFSVTVQIDDGNGGVDEASTTLSVNNSDPEIGSLSSDSPGCGGVAEGNEVHISSTFADPGPADTHSAVVDWGDGTITAGVVTETAGAGTVTASHTYTDGGVYTITVTLTDDDLASAEASAPAVIVGAGVNGNVLQVIGTDLPDSVAVYLQDTDTLKVQADFIAMSGNIKTFGAATVSEILVVLCDGADHGTVSSSIGLPATIDGGAANDHIRGGSGPNVLLGSEGDDLLVGGTNRDLIIGGLGADRLVGKPEDDIMIGGVTLFEGLLDAADFTGFADRHQALHAIMAEWTSERDYATRVANLADGSGSTDAANCSVYLVADETVFDDDAKDIMTGSAGTDWFFANLEGEGVLDKITDLSDDEFAADLDFILEAI